MGVWREQCRPREEHVHRSSGRECLAVEDGVSSSGAGGIYHYLEGTT